MNIQPFYTANVNINVQKNSMKHFGRIRNEDMWAPLFCSGGEFLSVMLNSLQ